MKSFTSPEAEKVREKVVKIPGGQAKVDEFVLTLNRAAEDAALSAKPIFVDIDISTFNINPDEIEQKINLWNIWFNSLFRFEIYDTCI